MRVLIVEDEKDLAAALKRTLIEEGYACDVAHEGRDGLSKACSTEYDAIVLDLMLPGLDGRQLLARLRASRPTPVLVLSARAALGERVELLDSGADDYLTKPFELDELLARVRALIRRAARAPARALELGDVRIDTVARSVTRAGAPVLLSPKEYALVEYMAFHRGELVTRSMLYDHLYDEDEDTLSNVLDVYISNIRKRLGREFVRTRRGEGYVVDG